MTVREIEAFLTEQYGTEVSAEFISSVTDAVMAEVPAPPVQVKADTVIEHRVAPAGAHDTAPVDAGPALPVGRGPVPQAAFGGTVLRRLRPLAPA